MKYQDALLAMKATRPMLMERWGNADITAFKSDSAVDVVTETDVAVERQVSAALTAAYPDIGFVGEEDGGDRTASRFWLMDPIDGTGIFVRGMPFSTSMLALIEDGKVSFGAIYDFANDHMYFAERGAGAFREDERLRVSDRPLRNSYLFWEAKYDTPAGKAAFEGLRKKTAMLKTMSAGWEYAMIASGKAEGRVNVEPWGHDYDFAPGSLLVEEAGGIVANIGSRDYDYRNTNMIAANPVVFKDLTEGPDSLFPIP
jgi:myo-inositol-1(or 4)-monophosphatase